MSAVRALFTRRRIIRVAIVAAVVLIVRSFFFCPPLLCPEHGARPFTLEDQRSEKYSDNGLLVSPDVDELPRPQQPPQPPSRPSDEEQTPVRHVEAAHPPLPGQSDRPPGEKSADSKVLVIASMKRDDTSWYHEFFPDWPKAMYVMDDPKANLTVARNKGRESTAYLTYIIDNYDNLPENIFFLHSTRYQWHNEDPMYDGVPPIKNLRLQYVQEHGYANMRCTWVLGCPAELRPSMDNTELDATTGGGKDRDNTEAAYTRAFLELFPDAKPGETPTAVGIQCGAQFALARWLVQKRPVADYRRYRDWLWDTQLPDAVSGRILEYTWHIIMGKAFAYCPEAKGCFCHKFGLCELECGTPGSCEKRYKLPRFATMPQGWPHKGAGENGFPAWGWWE